jgi:hypothetical protein
VAGVAVTPPADTVAALQGAGLLGHNGDIKVDERAAKRVHAFMLTLHPLNIDGGNDSTVAQAAIRLRRVKLRSVLPSSSVPGPAR